jgi:hypothetical protein
LHENVLSAVRVEVYLGAIPGLRIGFLSLVPGTATRRGQKLEENAD